VITFPQTVEAATRASGTFRAGATDLQERRHLKMNGGPLVDLRDLSGADAITVTPSGGLRVGALVRVRDLAADARIRGSYPGLAAAAGGLGTPQIRARGTVGGNLLQDVRCWYYRRRPVEGQRCRRAGGGLCLARAGDHIRHACFDLGPCVTPHPSTLAMALLAMGAGVEVAAPDGWQIRTIPELLGDGTDPTRAHALGPGELLTAVVLPTPVVGERSAYLRAISRAHAEWPLVETLARLLVVEGRVVHAALALGGVAVRPIAVSAEPLLGQPASAAAFAALGEAAIADASPLPMTGYKVPLVAATIAAALEQAAEAPAALALPESAE